MAIFSSDTKKSIKFDIIRLRARILNSFSKSNFSTHQNLHLGCGSRKVEGWINIDVIGSDLDVDLAYGKIPLSNNSIKAIASQHLIEHLELERELLPLMEELYRISKPGCEIWLSTPDLEKACNSYAVDKAIGLYEDRKTRFKSYSMGNIPTQHFINLLFRQNGEHKNLFDFEMLEWMLARAGFINCKRVDETIFLNRFPEFPKRNDDFQSIYVFAVKK